MIKYLENDFQKEIEGKKVLVDFYADWCGPCRMMMPVLEKFQDIDIIKVNVDKYSDLAQLYGVMSIPSLFIFENGQPIKNSVGFMNESQLRDFLK